MDLTQIIIFLIVLLFSVITHEFAHGWVALKCGDPTARDAGRLTFNPIPHIDPFMTILLPAFLILSGWGIVFGGAKPVPVNPYNFKRGEKDNVLVSFAGPAANIILALLAFIISIGVIYLFKATGARLFLSIFKLLNIVILLNLVLANFNLLPIPPLDGSHILAFFLKGGVKVAYLRLGRYGFLILMGVIILGKRLPIPGGVFGLLLTPSMEMIHLFNSILYRL